MDKTKEVIGNFMSKSGHHDTTVHETVNPAVQHETIRPQQHEEVNTAVDKEVHQDHYHHTVQPVHDKEVLATKHHHNVAQAEHRTFDNRDDSKVKAHLEREAAKWKDESVRSETAHTQSHAPVVQGEHVHHHVHETYQPVVHKEVVEPHVVHTTIPIHETHHNEAKHHATSTLPAVSLAEFKQHGGTHTGGQHEHHKFDGCPDVDGGAHKGLTGSHSHGTTGATTGRSAIGAGRRRGSNSSSSSSDREGTRGPHKSKMANALDPRVDSDGDHRGNRNDQRTGTTGGFAAGTTGPSSTTGNYGHSTGSHATSGGAATSAAGAAMGGRGVGNSHDSTPRTAGSTGTTGHHDSTTPHESKGLISKVLDKVNSSRS